MGLMDIIRQLFGVTSTTKNKVTTPQEPVVPDILREKFSNMRLLLNDPMTPELTLDTTLVKPTRICPAFTVKGFNGPSVQMHTVEWRAAQTYCTFLNTLHIMQPAFSTPVSGWPGARNLIVLPEAGVDLNAYYDRRSLRFFYAADPITNKNVYTSESVDIVAHELGHALLDAIRPDLWSMQALEIWSFHEAWSDIVAMLTVMKYEDVLKHAIREGGPDFNQSNVISKLAEEMGQTIFNVTKGRGGRRMGALRDANNTFVYTQPEKLPQHTTDDKLAAECHSFGRVFLGAYYEVMTKMFRQEVSGGANPVDALKTVRTASAKLLARSAQIAPATPRFYDAVARTMLNLDNQWGGKYQTILKETFTARKILHKRTVKAQSIMKFSDLNLTDEDRVEMRNGLAAVRLHGSKVLKLSDHFGLKAQSDNPLYSCEIEVPNETYLEFDEQGNLIDSVATSERVAINSARECIKFIHDQNLFSTGPQSENSIDKQFSIVDGRLVRNFFI